VLEVLEVLELALDTAPPDPVELELARPPAPVVLLAGVCPPAPVVLELLAPVTRGTSFVP
jgi:hypothetical protein